MISGMLLVGVSGVLCWERSGQCDLWLSSPDSVISGMLLVGVRGELCWERSGQCDLLDGVVYWTV